MNRAELTLRVRSLTRDLSNAIFREIDVVDYINEGIDRMRQVVPEFGALQPLVSNNDTPTMIPSHYHHLLAVYSASRCFGQDERHYQATSFMNEFEAKLDELKSDIESGKVIITDPVTGEPITSINRTEYVRDNYFFKRNGLIDMDKGVEGI